MTAATVLCLASELALRYRLRCIKGELPVVQVHIVVGIITLIVALFTLIWNAMRFAGQSSRKSYRVVLVAILDLQVLLGIITWILNHVGGRFILHPILMLVAVAIAHTMLKESKRPQTQLTGYSLVLLLLIVGAWVGNL